MNIQAKLIGVIVALLALIAVAVACYQLGNVHGSNSEKVKSQAADISRKDAALEALQVAAERNRQLAAKQAADAKQEDENHEKELAAVRARVAADAARRVRVDRAEFCGGDTPGAPQAVTPGSAGQTDPGAAFLPESFTGDLRQLAASADEVTADLRNLKARVEAAGCFVGQ